MRDLPPARNRSQTTSKQHAMPDRWRCQTRSRFKSAAIAAHDGSPLKIVAPDKLAFWIE